MRYTITATRADILVAILAIVAAFAAADAVTASMLGLPVERAHVVITGAALTVIIALSLPRRRA